MTMITTGGDLIKLAKTRVGCKYQLGIIVPKANSSYRGAFDCAEFTSWVVYQKTKALYGCANNFGNPNSADAYSGFWGRDAREIGIHISINEAYQTVGACLLRLAGNGLIGHIVFSDGKGGTVEAHSSKKGVIESVVTGRRWDTGILVPWVSYTSFVIDEDVDEVNKKPAGKIYRYTSPMMRGAAIKELQKALNVKPVDGLFGMATFSAVKSFQISKGLVADGEAGKLTLKALGLLHLL